MSESAVERLAGRLAEVPGLTVRAAAPLARLTTLRIGGPAELLAEIGSERALVAVLAACRAAGVPFHLLGLGSNVLVPDEGLPGVIGRLGGALKRVRIHGALVSAGAGAALAQVARRASRAGLAGLEALAGFPSTVGGAVHMNAGSYGAEVKDVLVSARVVELDGTRRRLATADLEPAYRTTILKRTGAIVTRALFELAPGDPEALVARMDELNAKRWAALPSGVPNAGSIFKNPPGRLRRPSARGLWPQGRHGRRRARERQARQRHRQHRRRPRRRRRRIDEPHARGGRREVRRPAGAGDRGARQPAPGALGGLDSERPRGRAQ